MTTETMDRIASEWLMARQVIADFIKELCPFMTQEHLEHNAAAVIARLAGHRPPLLISTPEELRE